MQTWPKNNSQHKTATCWDKKVTVSLNTWKLKHLLSRTAMSLVASRLRISGLWRKFTIWRKLLFLGVLFRKFSYQRGKYSRQTGRRDTWLNGIKFLLPEYLPVSEEIIFLFIAYMWPLMRKRSLRHVTFHRKTRLIVLFKRSLVCSVLLSSLSCFNGDGGTTAIGTSFGASGAGLRVGEAEGDTAVWSSRTLGCSVASFFLLSSPQPFTRVFCSSRNCRYRSLSPVSCDTSLLSTFSLLTKQSWL